MNAPKLFGVGLPRTGTASLAAALGMLGVNTVHNPTDIETIAQLKLGDFQLKILERVDCILDLPSAVFFEDYDLLYPGSKFILTTRSKEPWLASCEAFCHWLMLDTLAGIEEHRARTVGLATLLCGAMFGSLGFNRTRFARVYDQWHRRVTDHFQYRPEHLLLLDADWPPEIKWRRLCRFLDKPVPDADYPHINRRDELHVVAKN